MVSLQVQTGLSRAKFVTLRSALPRNLQCGIDSNHMIIIWLVRYVATLITVYQVGKDCKTAYQRRKGKTIRQPLLDFGENYARVIKQQT